MHILWYMALTLGIVQGLTEFIPVSSTAHLVVIPWLLGWPDPGHTFDVALHAGTLAALIVYFRRDIKKLLVRDHRLLGILLLATIPGGLVGVLFESKIDRLAEPETHHYALLLIGVLMALLGVVLWISDRVGAKRVPTNRVTLAQGLGIGAAQMLALLPGVSRSGSTITAGLFAGLTREAAARFSFLLSLPIIAGAVFWKGLKVVMHKGGAGIGWDAFTIGVVASAIAGYFAIDVMMRYIKAKGVTAFVVYRLIAGAAIIFLYVARYRLFLSFR